MFRLNWKTILFCSCFLTVIAVTPHPAFGLPPGNNALDFDGEDDFLEVFDPVSLTGREVFVWQGEGDVRGLAG